MGTTEISNPGRALHVMMFPFLAFGHISPFLQLARKISAADPTIHITFLSAPANVPRLSSLLPSSPSVRVHPLTLPAVPGLHPGAESTADLTPAMAERLKLAVDLMKPQVESLLSKGRPQIIVYDFAQPWLPSIAAPLGIKTLFFSVFSAISTAYLTVPSRRHSSTLNDLKKSPDGFPSTSSIAAVPTYQAADFAYIFKSFDGGPTIYDRVVTCIQDCDAIVAKSCTEMEGQYISYIESQYHKPMLLAGPVVPGPLSGDDLEDKWAKWLDRFEDGSVVFCSFGSETFLTEDGVRELVLGLEMSGVPFLVVLNFPGDGGEEELRRKLPKGFEEGVRGRGVVHRGWVQQQLILNHRSVGCFLCHAGLSSVMEGVVSGCQLVMLPQRGDQFLNSALFAADLGIGVEVRREEEDGKFGKEGISEAVKKVVTGKEGGDRVRENHRRWREFLTDRRFQEKFTVEFVKRLKDFGSSCRLRVC